LYDFATYWYEYLVVVGLLLLTVPLFFALWRRRTTSDQVLVFQIFGTLGVLISAALTVPSQRAFYVDVALLLALFNFLGVLLFARYLGRGLLR